MDTQLAFLLMFAACWAVSAGATPAVCRHRLGGWLKSSVEPQADAPRSNAVAAAERSEVAQLRDRVQQLEAVVSEREFELNEKLRRL